MATIVAFLQWLLDDDRRVARYARFVRASMFPLLTLAVAIGAGGAYLINKYPSVWLAGAAIAAAGSVFGVAALKEWITLHLQARRDAALAAADGATADGATADGTAGADAAAGGRSAGGGSVDGGAADGGARGGAAAGGVTARAAAAAANDDGAPDTTADAASDATT